MLFPLPMFYSIRHSVLAALCAASCIAAETTTPSAAGSSNSSTAIANSADAARLLFDASGETKALLERAELNAYHGWIKYLRLEAETQIARTGSTSEAAVKKAQRLLEWETKIAKQPDLLKSLTGSIEWAYESAADDSGQPFKIAIPTDYDPKKPAPLMVYMHGYSGNHLEHATGIVSHPGEFEISVLGRGRGGAYRALSEADVLDVIRYVQAHWSIDADRIRLNGGSMGGGGTYRLGSRYPHLFASGRPTCGFLSFLPVGNLLTFPIYATHSADDPVVSVLHDRGPLALLREQGGAVIYDEANGYGHAVWNYKEGNERGAAWEKFQVRPASKSIRHIDYTALDGGTVRGWWGEIAEWGAAAKPARFVLSVGANNTVYAQLTNIDALRLRVAEAPIDSTAPLQVSVNGGVPLVFNSPLPEKVLILRDGATWKIEKGAPATGPRLHTPGSASLLYNGEPLLIVYGTGGNESERSAMHAAAVAASKSPNPAWLDDTGEKGEDGVPHSQNLYGKLNTKRDIEVTDADIARCHLVLIGTAEQNKVVQRLAEKLPVKFSNGNVICDDGVKFEGGHQQLGLVHFNPLAPDRLIFWVASSEASSYAANSAIPALTSGRDLAGSICGADLMVLDAAEPTAVAMRSFDSHWHWSKAREATPLVPASVVKYSELNEALALGLRRETNAQFAILPMYAPGDRVAVRSGVTRVGDLSPLFYYSPAGVLRVSGKELQKIETDLSSVPEPRPLTLYPKLGDKIDPAKKYEVALPASALWTLSQMTHGMAPEYRVARATMSDALDAAFEE